MIYFGPLSPLPPPRNGWFSLQLCKFSFPKSAVAKFPFKLFHQEYEGGCFFFILIKLIERKEIKQSLFWQHAHCRKVFLFCFLFFFENFSTKLLTNVWKKWTNGALGRQGERRCYTPLALPYFMANRKSFPLETQLLDYWRLKKWFRNKPALNNSTNICKRRKKL